MLTELQNVRNNLILLVQSRSNLIRKGLGNSMALEIIQIRNASSGYRKESPLTKCSLVFFFFALQPELKIRKEDFSHFTLQHPSERTRITWCAKGSPR